MLRALSLFIVVLVSPLSMAFADPGPDLGANAALKYWQAFAQLPKLPLAESEKLNAECLTMPLDDQVRGLLSKADYALEMMHYGAIQPNCDWGIAYEPGVATRLPQAQASRELSALACLRARMRFKEGRTADAVDDLVDCLTLSRHISVGSVSIMVLVGYSIENRAIQVLAHDLPKLNPEMLRSLAKRLDGLPQGGSQASALPLEERSFEISLVRPMKQVKDKEGLVNLLSQIVVSEGNAETSRDRASKLLDECGGTAEGVLAHVAALHESYAKMTQMAAMPLDRCVEAWEREKQAQASNAVFNVFAGLVPMIRWRQLQAETRMALLRAAMAVQLEGARALGNRSDPINNEPFVQVPFIDGGFELRTKQGLKDDLRAKLKLDEKSKEPLTLTVGESPQAKNK